MANLLRDLDSWQKLAEAAGPGGGGVGGRSDGKGKKKVQDTGKSKAGTQAAAKKKSKAMPSNTSDTSAAATPSPSSSLPSFVPSAAASVSTSAAASAGEQQIRHTIDYFRRNWIPPVSPVDPEPSTSASGWNVGFLGGSSKKPTAQAAAAAAAGAVRGRESRSKDGKEVREGVMEVGGGEGAAELIHRLAATADVGREEVGSDIGGVGAGREGVEAAAAAEKERGNEHFKKGRFEDALSCYSQSIALHPTAVAFANRAMAALKLGSA
ncbi:hypothetical protein CLOM_g13961 [Closterium sp. NIES-68]|nr:hypothetical protein CLOM_g13961 [Closterium sp. NIES-68]